MSLAFTYFCVLFAAIQWGANFNLAIPVVAEMPPVVAGATRYLLAALIMLTLTYIRGEHVPLRHARAYIVLGLVGVFGFNLLFFLGMQSTSAVNGALIMALNPLLTALIAWATIGERLQMRQWLAFPIGLLGVAIVVLGAGAHLEISHGDILIFLASLSWAAYNVCVKKMMPTDTSGIASTAAIMTVGALALTLVALLSGEQFVMPGQHAAIALLIMTIGGGVLAYLCWNAGIRRLGAGRAAIFLNLVPVTSMVIAAMEGVPPTTIQLTGAALVIGAVSFASWPRQQPTASPSATT
ncbi:DMT family transporter [Methylovorus sp. SPW-M1]